MKNRCYEIDTVIIYLNQGICFDVFNGYSNYNLCNPL